MFFLQNQSNKYGIQKTIQFLFLSYLQLLRCLRQYRVEDKTIAMFRFLHHKHGTTIEWDTPPIAITFDENILTTYGHELRQIRDINAIQQFQINIIHFGEAIELTKRQRFHTANEAGKYLNDIVIGIWW